MSVNPRAPHLGLQQPPTALDLPGDAELQRLTERAAEYAQNSHAENTLRAYRADWADFLAFCQARQAQALPAAPAVVGAYLTALAEQGRKTSTLKRRLVAIGKAHELAQQPNAARHAEVALVLAGIVREQGSMPVGKAPAMTADIRAMVDALPSGRLLATRDRALLLVGFAGGFRRSELVSLDVADLDFRRDGLVIMLRRSKTDQEGEGREIAVPYGSNPSTCPVRALQDWLKAAGISAGPVWRPIGKGDRLLTGRLSDKAVSLVVKRSAAAIGLDPSRFGGHSLRSGLATSAAAAGVPERMIARTTGHKSLDSLRGYIRKGDIWRECAASHVGL